MLHQRKRFRGLRFISSIPHYDEFSTPSKIVLETRRKFVDEIRFVINSTAKLFRNIRSADYLEIQTFGSIGFNLDSSLSDLDICILDPDRRDGVRSLDDDLPPVYDMRALARAFRNKGYRDLRPINNAKIPILKIRSKHHMNLSADINTNGLLGLINTRLLNAYHNLNPGMFRPLGLVIKLWAKARGIGDPSARSGTASLSSYSLILMLIGFLQSRGFLPNLQSPENLRGLKRNYIYTLDGHFGGKYKVFRRRSTDNTPSNPSNDTQSGWRYATRSSFNDSMEENEIVANDVTFVEKPPHEWRNPNEILPKNSDLLLGFFDYYSDFDFKQNMVSIRNGQPEKRPKPFRETIPKEEDNSNSKGAKIVDDRPAVRTDQSNLINTTAINNSERIDIDNNGGNQNVVEGELSSLRLLKLRDRDDQRGLITVEDNEEDFVRVESKRYESEGSSSEETIGEVSEEGGEERGNEGLVEGKLEEGNDGMIVIGFEKDHEFEPIVVKDPFVLTRNTCMNIRGETSKKIVREIKRAKKLIESGRGLVDLCNTG
ncbi:expressed protein [Phakopsora pachyrhizi]|uniref:polynucleotide adenylyltransferase n=1 Tax=Phakopsora pachyrhizi TaxID=170000 RepID=A0AAV0ANJ0_PHAPC|nr:expressed protein [Phakopsora pachyrhizi]